MEDNNALMFKNRVGDQHHCWTKGACTDESIPVTKLSMPPRSNRATACFEGTGDIEDTLTLQAVSGSKPSCAVMASAIVSVSGTAASRTMVLTIPILSLECPKETLDRKSSVKLSIWM